MADVHQLHILCRVCGGRLQRAKKRAPVHKCTNNTEGIEASFGISVGTDDPDVHPELFCNRCFAAMKRQSTAASKGIPYHHSVDAFCWIKHTAGDCTVCEHVDIITKGGGQNKLARKNRGRPSGCSPSATIAHIRRLVHNQPSYVDSTDEVEYLQEHVANLLCPICCDILKQPIELSCGRLVCAHCCCRWIELSPKPSCPGCYTHELDNLTIGLPSAVVYELLGALKLVCGTCQQKTTAAQLKQHKASQCKGHYEVPSPSQISAQEILARPVTAPTQPVERRLAEHLVRRLMTESEDKVVQIPTRGKPLSLLPVSTAIVSTSEASARTVQRLVRQVQGLRDTLGVGLEEELKVLSKSERQQLLQEACLPIEIPADHSLAMKANLSISWNKLRTLRRWLKMFHISLASERKQRSLAKETVGDNIAAEMVPFTFPAEGRGSEVHEAPFVYVPNLIARVSDTLNQHLQSGSGLTWHDSTIPSSEVWIKIGGDKGRGSFKLNMQVVNVSKPNSTRNTSLLAVFQAGDSTTNLHTALDQYREQIFEIQGMKWREWAIQVFFTGDYEFLCVMYGLSGASGRHCCLWCTIRSNQLKVPLSTRGHSPLRSLQSLKGDHQRFVSAGAYLKQAKEFNNVIGEVFFPIPLEKVCIPGLHMSLGIFNRLFNLLERACQDLDLEMAARAAGEGIGGPTYQQHVKALGDLARVKEQQESAQQRATLYGQLATHFLLSMPGSGQSPLVRQIEQEASAAKKEAEELAAEVTALNRVLAERFKHKDGPCFKSLDAALAKLHVQRQAYHGGTFVGNHVHKLLKEESADVLCSGIVAIAEEKCPELLQKAKDTYKRFTEVLTQYAKCHNVFNGGVVDDIAIDRLERDIAAFMERYREEFPTATVLPKMHILEDHVVPWMRRWHMGAGLMGEQGAESIHAHISKLETQYQGIVNPLERLRYIVQEHNVESTPGLNSLHPAPRKRQRPSEEAN